MFLKIFKMSFEGLSDAHELRKALENIGITEVNIDFNSFKPLKGWNILNRLCLRHTPGPGHWVAVYYRPDENTIIYFDPMGNIPDISQICDFDAVICDMSGRQNINGTSCGYRCVAYIGILQKCTSSQLLNHFKKAKIIKLYPKRNIAEYSKDINFDKIKKYNEIINELI